jgi:RNA polymerase sigma factor (sigma-70 family)
MQGQDPLRNPEPLVRAVYGYVAYRIGPGPDAEDVTSDVFERALRYRNSFDPNRGTPIAWLIGIARRSMNGDRPAEQIPLDDAPEIAAATNLEETILQTLSLQEAVSQLSERDRELIALRYGADLPSREIADALSLSPNAVDVALHRAIERLRQALDRSE